MKIFKYKDSIIEKPDSYGCNVSALLIGKSNEGATLEAMREKFPNEEIFTHETTIFKRGEENSLEEIVYYYIGLPCENPTIYKSIENWEYGRQDNHCTEVILQKEDMTRAIYINHHIGGHCSLQTLLDDTREHLESRLLVKGEDDCYGYDCYGIEMFTRGGLGMFLEFDDINDVMNSIVSIRIVEEV